VADHHNPEAERKIYFYRAFPQDEDPQFELDRAAVCEAITALKGTDGFYLDEGADKITCGEIVSDKLPPRVKLYAIRRENLPSRDSGDGVIEELQLQEAEGLAEAIHIRLYPNSIIAAEFFYYGPRISRFQTFLNQRCDQQVVLKELIRGDAIERALKLKDVRALRVKIHPSDVSKQKASDLGFDGLMSTAKAFDAGIYADVTLRAAGADEGFTGKAKNLFRKLKSESPAHLFENLEVEGKGPESGKVEALNLLSDQLVRVAHIPRESTRTRALDSPAAFKAIHTAYNEVKDLLPSDAVTE
jgi:hypothetical protein